MGANKYWLRLYEWVASERELSREFGGRVAPFLGEWFPGCLARLCRDHFFIFSFAIVWVQIFACPLGREIN